MAIFKCKMCGGALSVQDGQSVIVCDYCSTSQTLPRLNTERRAQLYDRANHHLRNNEYDKAMGMYESILNEDSTDYEAYWSIVLCRFGVSYVKDPDSGKYFLTVNRMLKTSIKTDADFKAAYQYANEEQRAIYLQEAKKILAIQQKYDAIYKEEEPFDIFISYKETDEYGNITHDSVLAYELYHQLTQEGFKVFFARVSLENKLGTEYEPYIFAALNSSKVMVVLGTKPEHFNAIWVKNEWSRYLALIRNGEQKVLIPAYKDMDPYDMPDEFQHLQAQDMSKLGFMQDLVRGINKILSKDKPQNQAAVESSAGAAGAVVATGATGQLLKRAMLFLEDGDWAKADEYCERVLDQDPENAVAYLVKLCVDLKVNSFNMLSEQNAPVAKHPMFNKAVKYADAQLKETIKKLDNTQKLEEKKAEKIKKAEKYLEAGYPGQAAVWYLRAREFEKSRQIYDFQDKVFEERLSDEQMIFFADGSYHHIRNAHALSSSYKSLPALPNGKYRMATGYSTEFSAVRTDGKVFSFLKDPDIKNWQNVKKIYIDFHGMIAVKNDGSVVVTQNAADEWKTISGEKNVVDIGYNYLLKDDGTIVTRDNRWVSIVSKWSDIGFVSACGNYLTAIKNDGTVLTTSDAFDVSDLNDIVYVSSWYFRNSQENEEIDMVAVNSSGQVIYRGNAGSGAWIRAVESWKNIVAVYRVRRGVIGLTEDGSIVSTYDTGLQNMNFFPHVDNENDELEDVSDIDTDNFRECGMLLKRILSGLSQNKDCYTETAKYAPLSDFSYNSKSSLYMELETLHKNKTKYQKFIADELRKRGYQNIYVKIDYSEGERFTTKGDRERYDKDTQYYYKVKWDTDYDRSYRDSLKEPVLEKSGVTYTYSVTVMVGQSGMDRLKQMEDDAKNKPVSSSSKSGNKPKIQTAVFESKKLIKIIVSIVVILVLGVFVLATGNYPGGDGLVGDIFRTLSNNIGDIKDTFGIADDEEKTTEAHDYYIKSNDYDSINIRTKSNSDSAVLTTVTSRSVKLYPTGERSGKWIQIMIDGETGWVHNSVVEYVE